jgi:hypothetical protein
VFMKIEDLQGFSVNGFERAKAVTASATDKLQAITAEATDYSKKSFESGRAFTEKLLQVRKPEEFIEVQSSFAKAAYDDFAASAKRIGELYAELTKEAFKAFTTTTTTNDAVKPATPAKAPAVVKDKSSV